MRGQRAVRGCARCSPPRPPFMDRGWATRWRSSRTGASLAPRAASASAMLARKLHRAARSGCWRTATSSRSMPPPVRSRWRSATRRSLPAARHGCRAGRIIRAAPCGSTPSWWARRGMALSRTQEGLQKSSAMRTYEFVNFASVLSIGLLAGGIIVGAADSAGAQTNDLRTGFYSFSPAVPQPSPSNLVARKELSADDARRAHDAYLQGDYATARQVWEKAAEEGDVLAQWRLG